jgi:site-specific DNA recombinase
MNAAIYARKSTEQIGVEDSNKSVTRQTEGGRRFCAEKGWSVTAIYEDDGVSGAYFTSRPEFQKMMRDAESGLFEAVVLFDLDRLGRDGQQTIAALHKLADSGVTVYDYTTGQPVDIESFEGDLGTYLKAKFAEQYREGIRKSTRAALRRKAALGHATGGKLFGYDNICSACGQIVPPRGKRCCTSGHSERRINTEEAAVVRDIFERAARGEGVRLIALSLNQLGIPSPRSANGWNATTIRKLLTRPLYRGDMVYGQTKREYSRKLKRERKRLKQDETACEYGQIPQAEETWVSRPMPELRLVDPDLVVLVDNRMKDRRDRYFASLESEVKRPDAAHGKYLLSGGMLVCDICGANYEAVKVPWKPDGIYICSTRRRKGAAMCKNVLTISIKFADEVVLEAVEGELLGARYIAELLSMVEHTPDISLELIRQRDRLKGEVAYLVESIAAGVPAATVAPTIKDREKQIRSLEERLAAPRPGSVDREKLRAALERRTEEWKSILRTEPKMARSLLRRLVDPIQISETAEHRKIIAEWEAKPIPEGMFEGLLGSAYISQTSGTQSCQLVSPIKGAFRRAA